MFDGFAGWSKTRIKEGIHDAVSTIERLLTREDALRWLLGALEEDRNTSWNLIAREACELELINLLDKMTK